MMNRYVCFLLFCFSLFLFGCSGKEDPEVVAKRKISVACSNQILADFVAKIGGDRVRPFVLSTHTFHEDWSQKRVPEADLYVVLGEGCEPSFKDLKKSYKSRVVPVLDKIDQELIREDSLNSGQRDCHFWFSDRVIMPVGEVIASSLSSFDPYHKKDYQQRYGMFKGEITKAFQKFDSVLAHVPKSQRILVTTHDGLQYFGERFSFETYGLWSDSHQKVSDRDVVRLADFIVKKWVRYVFVEYPEDDKWASLLVNAVSDRGWQVEVQPIFIHDLGEETVSKNLFLDVLDGNVSLFRKLLGSDLDAMTIDDYLSSFD